MEKIKNVLKNKYLWTISLLLIFSVSVFIILGGRNKEGYLLISNISSLKCYEMDECKKIETDKILEKKLTFKVYNEFENLGEYTLGYIDKWNFFDLNGNWKLIEDGFIAESNLDLVVKDFTTRKMNNEEIALLNKLLSKKGINSYKELSQNEVLEYDFNQDGKTDKVIIASNVTDETDDEKLFSIIISVIKGKSSIVEFEVNNQYENFYAPAYRIKGIINLFNKKYDYLLITKGYFSEVGTSSSLIYKVDKKTLNNIVRN